MLVPHSLVSQVLEQLQDEDADVPSSGAGSLRRNAEVTDALRAGLDLGQQRGSADAMADESVSLSPDFSRSVSQAVSGADALPAPAVASAQQKRAGRKGAAAAGDASPRRGSGAPREAAPLSEELLSRHSASLDDAGSLNGGQPLMGSGGVLEHLHKELEALELPEGVSGGLFDEDEADEAFVDSTEVFHSPEQQLRTSSQNGA